METLNHSTWKNQLSSTPAFPTSTWESAACRPSAMCRLCHSVTRLPGTNGPEGKDPQEMPSPPLSPLPQLHLDPAPPPLLSKPQQSWAWILSPDGLRCHIPSLCSGLPLGLTAGFRQNTDSESVWKGPVPAEDLSILGQAALGVVIFGGSRRCVRRRGLLPFH